MTRRSNDSMIRSCKLPAGNLVRIAVASALVGGIPVFAYAQPETTAEPSDSIHEVVVTGSRIQRQDMDAPAPIVTVERETIQNSAFTSLDQVLNELPQFVTGSISGGNAGLSGEFLSNDVQPSATNSPGAATVNLRGLGANRSLTLIDGRRGQPSNASLTIDLNTIPSSAIASVEVMSGGASAVYGADGVAGVTNFRLRDNFQGVEISARGGINEQGSDGKDWQLSGLLGTSLGEKGNVMVSMEWYRRQEAFRGNREWFRDAWSDPTVGSTLARVNFPSVEFAGSTVNSGPSSTNSGIVTGNAPSPAALNAAFPGRTGNIPPNSTIYFNNDNSLFLLGPNANYPGGIGFNSGELDGRPFKISNSYNGSGGIVGTTLGQNDPDAWLSTPMERFSFFSRGKYRFNDRVQAYAQVNFASTEVRQRLQPSGATGNFAAAIPHGDQIYLPSVVQVATPTAPVGSTRPEYRAGGTLGLNCPDMGGCTLSQAFPVPDALAVLLASRAASPNCVLRTNTGAGTVNQQNPLTGQDQLTCGPNAAWRLSQTLDFLPTRGTENTQRLYQMIAGLDGDLGFGDWTWEAYLSHGNTLVQSSYIGYPSTEQYRAIVQAPNYGRNYRSPNYLNSKAVTCTSGLPIFEDFEVSQDCIDAIITDSADRSTMTQDIYEANFQGGLFELPAGRVRGALGLSYRKNDYDFRPDPIRLSNYIQDVGVGQFGAVRSGGATRVREVYGELMVPVFRDLPGAHRLDLELGYRYSSYDSGAGEVPTWKALANWYPVRWINVRGGYQKANRAPNIAELYLGETTVVTFTGVDPCRTNNTVQQPWYNNAQNPDRAQLQALCSAQIANPNSDFDTDPNAFVAGGGGLQIQRGNPALESEEGETWTIGTVFRSPFSHPLARGLSASVDYYKVKIDNNIGLMNVQAVLDACFNSQGENPTYSLNDAGGNCARILRDPFTGGLSRVDTPYANLGGLETTGMDVRLDWGAAFADLGLNLPGRFSTSLQGSRVFHYLSQPTATSQPQENVGFSNLPKWRVVGRMSYVTRSFSTGITWRYQTSVESGARMNNPNALNQGGPSYSRFDANAGYRWGEVDLRLSISNLFNEAPPRYGYNPWSTGAGTFLPGADLVGRRYTVTATMSF